MCKGNPFSFPFTKVDWVVKRWLVYLSVYMISDATNMLFLCYKRIPELTVFSLLFWLVRVNRGRVRNPSNQHWTWAHTRCGATFQAPQQPPQCLETQLRQSRVSQGHVALCKRKKVAVNPTVCAPEFTLASLMRVMFALINGNHISLWIFWNELSFWKGCANSLWSPHWHFCCSAHH